MKDDAIDELRKRIGAKIQSVRKTLGLSADQVAKQLGITRAGLTLVETGRNNINAVMLWRIACLFKCEVSDLLPPTLKNHGLSKVDFDRLKKEDKNAPLWAEKLFLK